MNTNRSILPFVALLAGFILLISKTPYLIIPGCILLLAGMFTPFYEDQLSLLFHRSKTRFSALPNDPSVKANLSRQTEPALENAMHITAPSGQEMLVAASPASGNNRALEAAWLSIRKIQSSLLKETQKTNANELKITALRVKMYGERVTQKEIDQTKELVQLVFPEADIKEDIPQVMTPDLQKPDTEANEIKVQLEAIVHE